MKLTNKRILNHFPSRLTFTGNCQNNFSLLMKFSFMFPMIELFSPRRKVFLSEAIHSENIYSAPFIVRYVCLWKYEENNSDEWNEHTAFFKQCLTIEVGVIGALMFSLKEKISCNSGLLAIIWGLRVTQHL